MLKAALIFSLCFLPTVSLAGDGPGGDAKRQEHFMQAKNIKLEGVRGRMAILQDGLSCVQAANDHQAMEQCDHKERSAMESLMQQQKQKWEALKPSK